MSNLSITRSFLSFGFSLYKAKLDFFRKFSLPIVATDCVCVCVYVCACVLPHEKQWTVNVHFLSKPTASMVFSSQLRHRKCGALALWPPSSLAGYDRQEVVLGVLVTMHQ